METVPRVPFFLETWSHVIISHHEMPINWLCARAPAGRSTAGPETKARVLAGLDRRGVPGPGHGGRRDRGGMHGVRAASTEGAVARRGTRADNGQSTCGSKACAARDGDSEGR